MNTQETIALILEFINWNFTQIRGDWSDPRGHCRLGWEAVEYLNKINRGTANEEELGAYLEQIREAMSNEPND